MKQIMLGPSGRIGKTYHYFKKNLKKGDCETFESSEGIMINRFMDRKEVILMTTRKYDRSLVKIEKKGQRSYYIYPMVNDYNKNKFSVDLSDQIASYDNSVRRSNKWYRKVGLNFIINIIINNARIIYNLHRHENLGINAFKKALCLNLLGDSTLGDRRRSHFKVVFRDLGYRRYFNCYKVARRLSKTVNESKRVCKRSNQYCVKDSAKKAVCPSCFGYLHGKGGCC